MVRLGEWLLIGVLALAACGKGDDKKAGAAASKPAATAGDGKGAAAGGAGDGKGAAAGGATVASGDAAATAAQIGVEPGAFAYGKDDAAAAIISVTTGALQVRRVGLEEWDNLAGDQTLHEGDALRTADASTATITLADESVVELAEQSAVVFGSRDAGADPASSVGVLYGVARFTVAERGAGEGAFLVYGPTGVVATKGTVYSVGVVASGDTRVGVESGEVEVIGSAKLDAPVALAAGNAVVIDPKGTVAAPAAIGTVDWGAWRDGAEAKVDLGAAAAYHAGAVVALEDQVDGAYGDLETESGPVADLEARAEASEQASDPAAYQAVQPELAGRVDASFLVSLRLQQLTFALMSHEYIADELYVRHPDEVRVVIDPIRPRLAGAVLYNKKYVVVVDQHLRPLRGVYYVHEPRGRARAKLVGYTVAPFYAGVQIAADVPMRADVRVGLFHPPIIARVSGRKRFRLGLDPGWVTTVHVRPAAVHGAWYVRPKASRGGVIVGARITGSIGPVYHVGAPRPRGRVSVRFGAGGAVEVHDHRGDVGGSAVQVHDHRGDVGVGAVQVHDHRGGVGGAVQIDHRGTSGGVTAIKHGGAAVRDHRGAGAAGAAVVHDHRGAGGAAVKVKVHRRR